VLRIRHSRGRYRLALTFDFHPRQGRFALALVVSLLLHGIFFALPAKKPPPLDASLPGPMNVTIVEAPPPTTPATVTPPQPAQETPPTKATPPPRPRVLAHAAPQPPQAQPAPLPPAPAPVPAPPAPDMLAMLDARRAQRRAERGSSSPPSGLPQASPENAVESPEQHALAAINRNLQTISGGDNKVGGVFQILRMGPRTGEFAFNGWAENRRGGWREVIEVDAGDKGNIERAMVDRMIDLIREHYQGDFNWHSQRQGKTIVLSARKEDHAQLEEYLMREFFGTPVVKQ
jgi:hypothetical protein